MKTKKEIEFEFTKKKADLKIMIMPLILNGLMYKEKPRKKH